MITFQLIVALLALGALIGAAYYIKNHREIPPYVVTVTKEIHVPVVPEPQPKYEPTNKTDEHETLSHVLKEVLSQITRCKAIAYVDITTLALMGVESVEPLPESVIKLIAAATADLFTAPNVIQVSNLYKLKKGRGLEHSNFHQMVVYGDDATYIFLRAQSDINHICVFACANDENVSNNLGILLHQARVSMPRIEVAAELAFLAE